MAVQDSTGSYFDLEDFLFKQAIVQKQAGKRACQR